MSRVLDRKGKDNRTVTEWTVEVQKKSCDTVKKNLEDRSERRRRRCPYNDSDM